jgi:hypothetical protein
MKLEGENDGLVSVKSCAWGDYIETLEAGTLWLHSIGRTFSYG